MLWDIHLLWGCRALASHSCGPLVHSGEQVSLWNHSLVPPPSFFLFSVPSVPSLRCFSCIFWTCVVEYVQLNLDILQPCGIWHPIYMQFCKCILYWNEVTNLSSCMCALWVWKTLLGEWIPFWSYHMFLIPLFAKSLYISRFKVTLWHWTTIDSYKVIKWWSILSHDMS